MSAQDELGALGSPAQVHAAVNEVLHRMWVAGGSDELRWFGIFDPDLDTYSAFFDDRGSAERYHAALGKVGDPEPEVRELTLAQALEALIASHRSRVRLAMMFGQKLKAGDLDLPDGGGS